VNQGSVLPPVFVVLEYNRDKKNLPLYAIVGKGITFDSGGISLKPAKSMQEMKYDKTGAVTAMGIIKAVSELGIPIRLIAAFAATENLPSGSAQKPGDIITAYNGKTIEVLNTDAEGRLILADSLAYVAEKRPKAIIDLATLTGAMIVSLGHNRLGLFSNDDHLAKVIYDSGEKTFERVWRFPLDREYKEMNKGDFADIRNIGSETGDAGSITAACFLSEFTGDCRWAHLDIAGVDSIAAPHGYLEKGASGIGVRLVVESLTRLARK
jgi:leucyl aminopeptidase